MKKIIAAFAAGVVALALSACGTTGTATSTSSASAAATASLILANLKIVIVNGCSVIQPTLESAGMLDSSINAVATANGLFCTAASAITVTSAQTLLDTGIPAVVNAVNASTFIGANQKPLIVAALSLFALTIKNAITAYNNAASAIIATSASAASAPVAASQ